MNLASPPSMHHSGGRRRPPALGEEHQRISDCNLAIRLQKALKTTSKFIHAKSNIGAIAPSCPAPTSAVSPNDGGPTRQVRCTHYSSCLDLTLDRKWPGFSCRECGAFDPEELEAADITEQGDRCRTLLRAGFHNRVTKRRANRILRIYEAGRAGVSLSPPNAANPQKTLIPTSRINLRSSDDPTPSRPRKCAV
mgnify:CR=1 FL=1